MLERNVGKRFTLRLAYALFTCDWCLILAPCTRVRCTCESQGEVFLKYQTWIKFKKRCVRHVCAFK